MIPIINEKTNNLAFFFAFIFCIVGIALLYASLTTSMPECNEGCQELSRTMNESQCPQQTQDELGVTDAAVYSPDGSLRSVTFLDCHTGEYRTYTSDNMPLAFPEMATVPVVYTNGEETSINIPTASLKNYNITQTAGGAVIYMNSAVYQYTAPIGPTRDGGALPSALISTKPGVEPSTSKEKTGFFEFVWHEQEPFKPAMKTQSEEFASQNN